MAASDCEAARDFAEQAALDAAISWASRAPLYARRVGKDGHQQDGSAASGGSWRILEPQPLSAASVVQVSRDQMRIEDVPRDGDCLFHCIGSEIRRMHGLNFSRPGQTAGARLRALYLRYLRNHRDVVIDGTSLAEWVQTSEAMTVEQYIEAMSVQWGGFLEIVVLRHIFAEKEKYRCCFALLSATSAGDAVICSVVGGLDLSARSAIIWTGTHWMIAQLTDNGWDSVRRWHSSDVGMHSDRVAKTDVEALRALRNRNEP